MLALYLVSIYLHSLFHQVMKCWLISENDFRVLLKDFTICFNVRLERKCKAFR